MKTRRVFASPQGHQRKHVRRNTVLFLPIADPSARIVDKSPKNDENARVFAPRRGPSVRTLSFISPPENHKKPPPRGKGAPLRSGGEPLCNEEEPL
jgi:hypothetical protein